MEDKSTAEIFAQITGGRMTHDELKAYVSELLGLNLRGEEATKRRVELAAKEEVTDAVVEQHRDVIAELLPTFCKQWDRAIRTRDHETAMGFVVTASTMGMAESSGSSALARLFGRTARLVANNPVLVRKTADNFVGTALNTTAPIGPYRLVARASPQLSQNPVVRRWIL